MSFAVHAQELRSAAHAYDGLADSLGGAVHTARPSPTSLGHIELAAWLVAVNEQCENAHGALKAGAAAIAGGLITSATAYEATDDNAGGLFASPFGGGTPLQGPLSPSGHTGPETAGGAR